MDDPLGNFITKLEFLGVEIALRNAVQSTTYDEGNCEGHKCAAPSAIDGTDDTGSLTTDVVDSWWRAEIVGVADVEKILLYLSVYNLNKGGYSNLTVQISMDGSSWRICKEHFDAVVINPYEVRCDQGRTTKYIRISTAIEKALRLMEVTVIGTNNISGKY